LINIYQKSHALTNTQKMVVLMGVTGGMRFLHSKHVRHRDAKPENVLLDEKLRPRICDFGVATIVGTSKGSM
jgi:serine/threonine protein kinase